MLNTPAEYVRFIEVQEPVVIASYLRQDQEFCSTGRLPSLLAWYLPPSTSRLGDAISTHLTSDTSLQGKKFAAVRHLQYDSVIQGIKAYLSQMGHDDQNGSQQTEEGRSNVTVSAVPSTGEFHSALKVLEYIQAHSSVLGLDESSPLTDVMTAVRAQSSLDPELRTVIETVSRQNKLPVRRRKQRKCYICRFMVSVPSELHDLYPALCRPCGNFNLAESELSLPHNLDLSGITALVTGGRVNLGFHTALRLLRCGARVIVSSRYPRDAENRYRDQAGSHSWIKRLKVVGADFRSARDAFRLIKVVRDVLNDWGTKEEGSKRYSGLNVLVNNAAQTLTDPVELESTAVSREQNLQRNPESGRLLVDDDRGYEARVSGGMQIPWAAVLEGKKPFLLEDSPENYNSSNPEDITKPPQKSLRNEIAARDDTTKSSWAQSINEIPYEDMISAHSVNAFVPLILCRELLPFMADAGRLSLKQKGEDRINVSAKESTEQAPQDKKSTPSPPRGYIINVSSREGLFEPVRKTSSKAGLHVHTNMSKAAINMITETEAGPAWGLHRIAMNTVDPGYMSAAPESRRDDEGCPIGFEDGAARVLWPVASGVTKGEPIWGRFLKHFGGRNVEVGLGRGCS